MGLQLRFCLFYGVKSEAIYKSYEKFYLQRGKPLKNSGHVPDYAFHLFERDNDWTILDLDRGWEREERQAAYLFTSKELHCPGFFIYVFDGDYWGYELFRDGNVLDRFHNDWEPDYIVFRSPEEQSSCDGNVDVILSQLPFLTRGEVASYLLSIRLTEDEEKRRDLWEQRKRLNVPPRPGDEFNRFDECAVLNFLRMLGVQVELRDHYVTLLAPEFRAFYIRTDH